MSTLIDRLEHWQALQPEQRLFEFRDGRGQFVERHSYRSLYERCQFLATHLAQCQGLRRGERVLLVYPPGLEAISALLACACAGLIGVPLPVPQARDDAAGRRLCAAAQDCSAKLLMSQGSALTRLRRLMTMDGQATSPLPSQWLDSQALVGAGAPAPLRLDGELFFLQYTSGSTGQARGVMVTHENILANAKASVDHRPIGVSWLPQHHDMGLIGYYLFPIVSGGSNIGFAPTDFLRRPALWLQLISEVGASHSSSPNFGFEYCLRAGKIKEEELEGLDLSSLRVLMNASEPVRQSSTQRFYRRFARYGLRREACTAAYGLAENTLTVTHGGLDGIRVLPQPGAALSLVPDDDGSTPAAQTYACCGKPAPGVALRICDPGSGAPLPELQVGEIQIAGASVTRGYWGREDQADGVFVTGTEPGLFDRHLRSGDLGFMHQGALYVCGRIKDLLIIGGLNIYPEDLERAAAASSQGPRLGGVCAFQGEDGRVVVVAEARRRQALPEPALLAQALRAACSVLPDLLLITAPRTVVKTTSGKVSRAHTKALFAVGALPVLASFKADSVPTEQPKAGDWRIQLQRIFNQHGVLDEERPLAEQGLDSLALIELQLDLAQALSGLGWKAIGEALDGPLLQAMSSKEVCQALAALDQDGALGEPQALAALQALRAALDDAVQEQMRRDRVYTPPHFATQQQRKEAGGELLLTGATGFFGPFLLQELLRQTEASIHVLVRADTPAEALQRIERAMLATRLLSPARWQALRGRVLPLCGDLSLPQWGLSAAAWGELSRRVSEVFHNGACVNYVMAYEAMRAANVEGTRSALQLAQQAGARLHLVSSTFVFGWSARGNLEESDCNAHMQALDFGYAQSKWVAEQLAWGAQAQGLEVHIYRPALISVSSQGAGDRNDVAVRLLAFMIRYGIAVDSTNQLSILPADLVARHIVGIARQPQAPPSAVHLTTDDCHSMTDLTKTISRMYGYRFQYFDIPNFIRQLNRLCSPRDPIFPLLDFFSRSAEKTAAMQLKRYSNRAYQAARARLPDALPAPSLEATASYLVGYLLAQGMAQAPSALGGFKQACSLHDAQPG